MDTRFFSRYWGDDDDRMSVASRKMTAYAKTDCVGASKGLFFGLLTLVSGLICLILFFVLIDHENRQIAQLAVYLADSSHCVILIVAILATFLGFIRYYMNHIKKILKLGHFSRQRPVFAPICCHLTENLKKCQINCVTDFSGFKR